MYCGIAYSIYAIPPSTEKARNMRAGITIPWLDNPYRIMLPFSYTLSEDTCVKC